MKKVIRLTESDLHNIVKESVVRIISEASGSQELTESKFGNALRVGALGAMMMFGGNNANAQNATPQVNDTVQTSQNGGISLGNTLRNKGYSDNDIQQAARTVNPSNIMLRNARGEVNREISRYLATLGRVSSSMSTDSIKVFNGRESKQRMNFLSRFNENDAKKYKLFFDKNENTFLMPINYTIKDVQRELDIFQLGDFDIE